MFLELFKGNVLQDFTEAPKETVPCLIGYSGSDVYVSAPG